MITHDLYMKNFILTYLYEKKTSICTIDLFYTFFVEKQKIELIYLIIKTKKT